MTKEILEHMQSIGSEVEPSLMTYDDHIELACALDKLAAFVLSTGNAKRERIRGEINRAIEWERDAQAAYAELPERARW